jgi:hypothetical protein
VPIPWSKDKEVALATVHDKVDDPPEVILLGDALKDEIVGAGVLDTVTVADEEAVPQVIV